jgi:hypothetical protein
VSTAHEQAPGPQVAYRGSYVRRITFG